MAALPTGTVTFLFTDLEASTRLWEEFPDAMRAALARHDEIIRDAIAARGGHVVKMAGDGAHAAFGTAGDAVHAALDAQLGLQRERWGETGALRVRMGVHTGTAELREGDYFGAEVNRAARLMAVAHGGQVVCSQATADLARGMIADGCVLVDLGEQQLRDLQTPERVFQLTHADLPAEFPALRTLDAFPGNLPVQVTEFIGRDRELVEVAKLLGRARVVTLTGAGGVGKTRLALQAAAEALPHYADGGWFVDLAPIDDAAFVPTEVATTMGLPEYRQGSPEEALVGALARRHALVILDNCEHLVDAVARLVDLVVHRCPAVTVVATSQEGLGVDGEVTLAVRPLRGEEAERLFVERAAAVRHGFEVTAEVEDTVAELCRRLDGIPLAIELAAARVASMSPAAILERIDERFRLLGQGRRTARRRHQTLRAAVDWSYGLLREPEQLVFERLAVFAGSFPLAAAEAVVADGDVDALDMLDLVSGLVAKSMLQLEERFDQDRYRLLETLRDYGLEHLAGRGDLERLQRRHAAYYLELAEEAAPRFVGSDELPWLNRIDDELSNLRAALTFLRDGGDHAAYQRLACALSRFWWMEGLYREGLAWLTSALALGPSDPSRERAEALAIAGEAAIMLDRYGEAFALIDDSLACSAAAGQTPSPVAFLALALAALVQNRPADACRFSEEAVAAAHADSDPYQLAQALSFAGNIIGLSDEGPHALELTDEGLTIARALGNTGQLSFALQCAGTIRSRTDPATAIELLAESFDLPGTQLRYGARGSVFSFKAVAHIKLRQYPAAAHELCLALPMLQEAGEPYQQAIALALAASVLSRPNPDYAVRLLALIDRLRDDGRFLGAPRDLESQALLRDRLHDRLDPIRFATLWAEGRAMTCDDAVAVALDELAAIAESGGPTETRTPYQPHGGTDA
jgi:predicted ATPase/class 3 adenylate cyclase